MHPMHLGALLLTIRQKQQSVEEKRDEKTIS